MRPGRRPPYCIGTAGQRAYDKPVRRGIRPTVAIKGGTTMRFKFSFIVGFCTGYVLGTKAGRKRYEAITDGVRRLVDSPVVQEAAGVLQAQASGAIATAKSSVTSKVSDSVTSRIGGYRSGRFFTTNHATTVDPAKAPPYPEAAHEEFGAES